MEQKSIKYTIYCHIHIESGRRYIGLTKMSMMKRWNSHVYNATSSCRKGWSHFANAIRKYGKDAFKHEVLEVCYSLEEANEAEKKWISHFDTRNPERGFNLAPGGIYKPNQKRKNPWNDPNYKWNDPLYRKRHGEKMKLIVNDPLVRQKIKKATLVIFRTDEYKSMLSARFRGKHLKIEHRKKISKTLSKNKRVEGHVNCSIHGLVDFDNCYSLKTKIGHIYYRCKFCIRERQNEKMKLLQKKGICISCKKLASNAGTRCHICACKRRKT